MEKKKIWTEDKGLFLIIIVLGIVFIVLFINVYYSPKTEGDEKYSVEIVEITGDCDKCFDISALADVLIKENNLNVKSREVLDYNSKEAGELLKEYDIKTIPALIVLSKDIGKIGIDEQLFSVKNNYALFDRSVPFIDLDTNGVKGLVKIKEIQPDNCTECASLSELESQLEKLSVKIENYEIISSSSDEGKDLIEKNKLDFTSVLLVSKDIEEYWWMFDQIKTSFVEKEDDYVFKTPFPPYIDLKDGEIKGKVDIIFIENKSCEECFNIIELKKSFQSLGVYFYNEKNVDISSSEGKNLLNKYNITAIPTIILSKEIHDYDSIKPVLDKIGSYEDDGKFVFRSLDSLNVKYQELN